MAETTAREAKLIQYLNEAYGKEQELVQSLTAHIAMTTRAPYKKRLQEHLRETKAQAKGLERRIKQLGGKAEAVDLPGPDAVADAATKVTAVAKRGVAAAKGPLHAIRGTGEAEKMLKNAKTEFWNEAEEIATYTGIEALATALSDRDTAKLAKEFRRQEERMQKFLERLIPQLTKAVVSEEIPPRQRKPSANGASPARKRTTTRKAASTTRKSSPSRSSAAKKTTSSSRSSGSRSTARTSTARKSSGSTSRRSTGSRSRRSSS
jgi:ferritin-like metal-binding protein YciE